MSIRLTTIILFLLTVLFFSCNIFKNREITFARKAIRGEVQQIIYKDYYQYFSLSPCKRKNFFEKHRDLAPIEISTLENDMKALTGYNNPRFYTMDDYEVTTIDSIFKKIVPVWDSILSCHSCSYPEKDTLYEYKPFLSTRAPDYALIYWYVSNSPLKRITYIEKYFSLIPDHILILFKRDLDNLFSVKNPSLIKKGVVDRSIFNTCKANWLKAHQQCIQKIK